MTTEDQVIPEPLIALAGFLAERGVQSLRLESPGGSRVLQARSTDLPFELALAIASGSATLHADSIGTVLRFQGESVTCECTLTADAIAITRLFARS